MNYNKNSICKKYLVSKVENCIDFPATQNPFPKCYNPQMLLFLYPLKCNISASIPPPPPLKSYVNIPNLTPPVLLTNICM